MGVNKEFLGTTCNLKIIYPQITPRTMYTHPRDNNTGIIGCTNTLSKSASSAAPEKKYKSFRENRVCLSADTGESADDIVSESSPEPLNIRHIWGGGVYTFRFAMAKKKQKNNQTKNHKTRKILKERPGLGLYIIEPPEVPSQLCEIHFSVFMQSLLLPLQQTCPSFSSDG